MQRYFSNEKENNYIRLSENDLHHIKNVMRNKIGDKIECIYHKNLYICEIESLTNPFVKIISKEDENHELNVNLTIAIALVKEQKMDIILQKLTELGVNRIIPLQMERSIVKLNNKKEENKIQRWTTICKEAAEQSKRNNIPEITNIMTIKELVTHSFDKKYICSTKENNNYLNEELKEDITGKNLLFIIGPEGGITDKEENFLMEYGITRVSLGSRIMRVETAAIYVASIINFCSMR